MASITIDGVDQNDLKCDICKKPLFKRTFTMSGITFTMNDATSTPQGRFHNACKRGENAEALAKEDEANKK